jgi:hypothetical protein
VSLRTIGSSAAEPIGRYRAPPGKKEQKGVARSFCQF